MKSFNYFIIDLRIDIKMAVITNVLITNVAITNVVIIAVVIQTSVISRLGY